MTAVIEQESVAKEAKPWGRRRDELGNNVAHVIFVLQKRLLAAKPDPKAVAALAQLRRGIGRQPGFDYGLDNHLGLSDEQLATIGDRVPDSGAADAEHAKHAAVTLYALHQQSQREHMHVDGTGLGRAVRELAKVSSGPEGVRRRFAALGTAISFDETLYHLRSLVVMLREHRIPLDYGLLADDLRLLRKPHGRESIQAIWGREFYRSKPESTDSETNAGTQEEEISE